MYLGKYSSPLLFAVLSNVYFLRMHRKYFSSNLILIAVISIAAA